MTIEQKAHRALLAYKASGVWSGGDDDDNEILRWEFIDAALAVLFEITGTTEEEI